MAEEKKISAEAKSLSRRGFLGRTGAAMASMGLAAPIPLALARAEGEPVRVALIGAGARMSALLPAILKENVSIVAVADPNPKSLNEKLDRIERATRKRAQGYTGENDYLAVLNRDDVQAVVSATPSDLHARTTLEAIARKKHLYIEKPACITLAECRELDAAERESGVAIVQTGFQRRLNPRYVEGIRLIHEGEIGNPIEGRAGWNVNIAIYGYNKAWLRSRERSGDWMIEQATQAWDVFNWITGARPLAAYGRGQRGLLKPIWPDRDMTDNYNAIVEYPNEFAVTYTHLWPVPHNDKGAFSGVYERVAGFKGGIDLAAGRISYTDASQPPRLLHERQPDATGRAIANFFECIATGARPASSLREGIDATLAGLLVRKAVDERRRVTMEEILQS
jgi:myo-inositol 2-dehydrogenase/D-chiro-inositol 1-dehydrogenase